MRKKFKVHKFNNDEMVFIEPKKRFNPEDLLSTLSKELCDSKKKIYYLDPEKKNGMGNIKKVALSLALSGLTILPIKYAIGVEEEFEKTHLKPTIKYTELSLEPLSENALGNHFELHSNDVKIPKNIEKTLTKNMTNWSKNFKKYGKEWLVNGNDPTFNIYAFSKIRNSKKSKKIRKRMLPRTLEYVNDIVKKEIGKNSIPKETYAMNIKDFKKIGNKYLCTSEIYTLDGKDVEEYRFVIDSNGRITGFWNAKINSEVGSRYLRDFTRLPL